MKMSWEMMGSLARIVVLTVLLLVLLLRMFEDRLIFFPNFNQTGNFDTRAMGLDFEDVFLTTADGVRIHAWWAPAAAGSAGEGEGAGEAPTILYLHGNAGNLSNRIENIVFLQQLPANVLALDYRRYGRSEGPFPTEQGVYRDAQAGYDHLVRERKVPPERIVPLGQSLGAAVAVEMAYRNPVGALVLEAGFPSLGRAAQRVFPVPGTRFLMRSSFDSAAKLQDINVPLLVAHCRTDPVLPFDLGEELFAAAHEPKELLPLDSICHEPLFDSAPRRYAERVRALFHRLPASERPAQ